MNKWAWPRIVAVVALYFMIGFLHAGYFLTHPRDLSKEQQGNLFSFSVVAWPAVDMLLLSITLGSLMP